MNIELFDTTLRDGAQARNISYSLRDKLKIVHILDQLGIHYIEAGNPGSNPKDLLFFEELSKQNLKKAKIVAFGSTRRKESKCEQDELLNQLASTYTKYVCIFGKSWDFHVTDVLKTSLDENLTMIKETIIYLKDLGKEVFFDAEHFYDGYQNNKEYAIQVLKVASNSGATRIILCDTNGGTFPSEIERITKEVIKELPDVLLGIHAHDDMGLAVANSHAAMDAGVIQVQGVYTGFGERCGNANLSTIIGNLKLKKNIDVISNEQLQSLTFSAVKIAEISNQKLYAGMPYVGRNAFSHKAGMHIDGVLKASSSFEHVDPNKVGNSRQILISEVSGKSAIVEQLQSIKPNLTKDSIETMNVIQAIKKFEQKGYQFELADASLELFMNKQLGLFKPSFDLEYYEVRDISTNGFLVLSTIKISMNGTTRLITQEGKGPIHALDKCLRIILEEFFPVLKNLKLEDYNVRVLDSDEKTDAGVRVVITTTDGMNTWNTIGVSHNVIEASLIALVDSFEYKLLKHNKEELVWE